MSGITVLDHGRRSNGRVGPAVVGPGNTVSVSQKVGPPPVKVRSRVGAVAGLRRGITQGGLLGVEGQIDAIAGEIQGITQRELGDLGVRSRVGSGVRAAAGMLATHDGRTPSSVGSLDAMWRPQNPVGRMRVANADYEAQRTVVRELERAGVSINSEEYREATSVRDTLAGYLAEAVGAVFGQAVRLPNPEDAQFRGRPDRDVIRETMRRLRMMVGAAVNPNPDDMGRGWLTVGEVRQMVRQLRARRYLAAMPTDDQGTEDTDSREFTLPLWRGDPPPEVSALLQRVLRR